MSNQVTEQPDLAKSKRQRIIEAAATVFCQDGYTGASIDAVATKAGVSRQTIYNHVGDKDGLFKEVVAALTDKAAAKFNDLMETFPTKPVDLEAEVIAFSARFLNQLTQDKTSRWLLRLAENEGGRYPDLFTVWREYGSGRKRSVVAAHLSELALEGHLEFDDPVLAARQYMALLTAEWRAEFQLGRFPSEEECVRMAERAAKTFLRAFARRR
ncbi:TetR/AcrR family transcriptional regulator [Allorhizobium taibaishanense]|uniref:AcrR family transcriptional regulator n=1 Tax=Allorhizobium taibaishanense TaxID=887144 RepID=A0A1Q9AAZ0_9HYPH|nr:TetR/AcrR family transcriptional regulator [Allorhizobium taibaishanense]MBB4010431.1 AcrR family transcriptional regulator [Allorhizobium taibaishanense]OLP51991.1 TetR family transcriptional regulator [Allorhizobium taibaishanense]